jgi:hypothetical protein
LRASPAEVHAHERQRSLLTIGNELIIGLDRSELEGREGALAAESQDLSRLLGIAAK